MTHLTIRKNNDFPHPHACMVNAHGIGKERPATVRQHRAGLTDTTPDLEALMAREALNARSDSAQPVFTDPLIEQARLVHWAAQLERNLAARKALRPVRSAAASRGWETRRG